MTNQNDTCGHVVPEGDTRCFLCGAVAGSEERSGE